MAVVISLEHRMGRGQSSAVLREKIAPHLTLPSLF